MNSSLKQGGDSPYEISEATPTIIIIAQCHMPCVIIYNNISEL